MNLVTTNKITVKYGSHAVLRDVSMRVRGPGGRPGPGVLRPRVLPGGQPRDRHGGAG